MKIPFIRVPPPDTVLFNKLLKRSIKAGVYTNFGLNEQELTSYFASMSGSLVIACANATLFLDFVHRHYKGMNALLPSFTFPATNNGFLPHNGSKAVFAETDRYGLAVHAPYRSGVRASYAITTAPFGAACYTGRPPNVEAWIVDNAAGLTPSCDRVNEWLRLGADAVVVSLHATKLLNAGEGALVFFSDEVLYEQYKSYINFGFAVELNGSKKLTQSGSNNKMSELNAALALSYVYSGKFTRSFKKRQKVADVYATFCDKHKIGYIRSEQAFWLDTGEKASKVIQAMLQFDVEARAYYSPHLSARSVDPIGYRMSEQGICLPSYPMSSAKQELILKALTKCLAPVQRT